MGKISKRAVDAKQPGKGDPKNGEFLWDSELRGFGCRVYPSGRKVYFVQYRLPNGRQRRLRLGAHGVLTPDQARLRAKGALAAVASGRDPAAERDENRRAITFGQVAELYLSDLAKRSGRPSTISEFRRLVDRHIIPALATRNLEAVSAEDIEALHRELERTPTTANRVLAVVSAILNHAEFRGLIPLGTNPCRLIARFVENHKGRALTGEELERLGIALDEAARLGSEHPSAILAIRLALLTGMRRTEILGAPFRARRTEWTGLKWDYIDFDARLIRLPKDKAGDGRVVLLSTEAITLLTNATRRAGNPYVCWGTGAAPFVGIDRPRRRIFQSAGIVDANFHSLRHTHGTTGGNLGLSSYLVARLLGHRDERTSTRYVHLADNPVRAAADRVSADIFRRLSVAEP